MKKELHREVTDRQKQCPICGRFMEKDESVKYAAMWKCSECNIVKYDREFIRASWKRLPKEPIIPRRTSKRT